MWFLKRKINNGRTAPLFVWFFFFLIDLNVFYQRVPSYQYDTFQNQSLWVLILNNQKFLYLATLILIVDTVVVNKLSSFQLDSWSRLIFQNSLSLRKLIHFEYILVVNQQIFGKHFVLFFITIPFPSLDRPV